MRRVELPVARTEGFSPRPKVSFGLALPTGAESLAEYLDIDLTTEVADGELQALPLRLTAALPAGVAVTAVGIVAPGTSSLQHEVTSCEWEITLPGADPSVVAAAADRAVAATSLVAVLERKGREVETDLRPAILSLAAQPSAEGPRLLVELTNGAADHEAGGRSVRPAEVVQAVLPDLGHLRLRRIAQWIERDGGRVEPLPAAPPAPLEQAS